MKMNSPPTYAIGVMRFEELRKSTRELLDFETHRLVINVTWGVLFESEASCRPSPRPQ